jgi:hypothetical protein
MLRLLLLLKARVCIVFLRSIMIFGSTELTARLRLTSFHKAETYRVSPETPGRRWNDNLSDFSREATCGAAKSFGEGLAAAPHAQVDGQMYQDFSESKQENHL